jgi:hypothetical protein
VGEGSKHLVEVTVTGGQTLTATDGHPFWLPSQRRWVPAEDLRTGDQLLTPTGALVQVTAAKAWTAPAKVNNLGVAGLHTYYVVAGTTPVLVHNCGVDDLDPWQVVDRVDAHVLNLHGPGTEASASKFVSGTTREDIVNMVHEGVSRSASTATGNHAHLVDLGPRIVGSVTTSGGVTRTTSRVKIWINDGALGTIHPTLEGS